MKKNKLYASIVAAALGLTVATPSAHAQHARYVGGDISMITQYDALSSGYLDGDGTKISDLVTWFKDECGWNTFRVRLFVNPSDPNKEGVIQDLEYVKTLGKRIKDAGCQFMLDFHYSDTWADASHHTAPAAWNDCTTAQQKADRLGQYTRECLQQLNAVGATPDLVQVGNEVMYGMAGVNVAPYDKADSDWSAFLLLMDSGCKAVRQECPHAKIIIHSDRPCNAAYNKYFYNRLADIDYDVIGLSYYPFWHGTLSDLDIALTSLEREQPTKKVQVVETAYNFQWWPSSGINYDTRKTWDCSADGQYLFLKDLVTTLSAHQNVEGLSYWFPEEAGCGDYADWNTGQGIVIKNWLNRGLWYEDATTTGHWPVKAKDGMAHYLLRNLLDSEADGINDVTIAPHTEGTTAVYSLSGTFVGNDLSTITTPGIYVTNNKKIIIR